MLETCLCAEWSVKCFLLLETKVASPIAERHQNHEEAVT